MFRLLPLLFLLFLSLAPTLSFAAENTASTGKASASAAKTAAQVVHVVVALCDNKYQGIVPVSSSLGNGQKPSSNLYWGAAFGMKTFLKKQADWELLLQSANPTTAILERVVFKKRNAELYIIADAWDGEQMQEATSTFLWYASGHSATRVDVPLPSPKAAPAKTLSLDAGGAADLVVFVGHNGLMDYPLSSLSIQPHLTEIIANAQAMKGKLPPKPVAVFACQSERYFKQVLTSIGSAPIALTTGNMAPEAYVTHALVEGWSQKNNKDALLDRLAKAYDRYQKCGIKGARRLFTQ